MELHELAAREVSALIDRIVADAEGRAHTIVERTEREHTAAMQAARAQLDAQTLELAARRHEAELQARELAARAQELDTCTRELDARSRELDTCARDLESRSRELETCARELEVRAREKDEIAAVAEDARAQLARAWRELETKRSELEVKRAELKAATREAEAQRELAEAGTSANAELQTVRAALEGAQAETQRLTRQFETALDELRNEHVNTLQQQAVARTALPLDELQAMFDALAAASSPSAVLTTIVTGLGREFSRVALFRVRGNGLECVKHHGFEFEGDVAKVVIPTSLDCLMTRAVTAKKTQTFVTGSSQEPCAVPFGGTPACAVALPLISGESSVAVIYADDSDLLEFGAVPSELLVKFAELVWQHAVLVLQRMASAQKMLAIPPAQSVERFA